MEEDALMNGYLARRRGRFYVVIYEGRDPSTGKELRRGSLLIKEGVPVRVVSERLGHAHIAHTIQTYLHLLPGMGADAARTYQRLAAPVPTAERDTVERRGNRRRNIA